MSQLNADEKGLDRCWAGRGLLIYLDVAVENFAGKYSAQ